MRPFPKKSCFFLPRGAVFFSDFQEWTTLDAEAKIAAEAGEIELRMRDYGLSPETAIKQAQERIDSHVKTAQDMIAPTPAAKNSPECQPYLARLSIAHDKAYKAMEDNKDRYNLVPAYVRISAGVRIELHTIKTSLDKLATDDPVNVEKLFDISSKLRKQREILLSVQSPAQEKDKTQLLNEINSQIQRAEKLKGTIGVDVENRLNQADEALKRANTSLVDEELPQARDIKIIDDHHKFLTAAVHNLESVDPKDRLIGNLQKKIHEMDLVIRKTDEKLAATSPEYKSARDRYGRHVGDLEAAKKNLDEVMADSNSTEKQKQEARERLKGAEERFAEEAGNLRSARIDAYKRPQYTPEPTI